MAFAPPSSFVTFARNLNSEIFFMFFSNFSRMATKRKFDSLNKLCNCLITNCVTRYCVCYSNGRTCSTSCSCDECFNRISSALSTEVYSLV
ncbi:hypothetical protein LXL04_005280 [Taraxacum kok-saghyz]